MAFVVHWCLATRDGQTIERGCFDSSFARREGAVRFVLEQIGIAGRYGYCAASDYWWLSGTADRDLQTRLWIDADAANCAQDVSDAGVA